MADVFFQSPPRTTPPANTPSRVFLTRVGWNLNSLKAETTARVEVTASPTPESITPNDGTHTTVGSFAIGSETFKDFTVTYPATASFPFGATLTAKLFIGSTLADSDDLDVTVTNPGGGGGGSPSDGGKA